jgi:hypothetical protein
VSSRAKLPLIPSGARNPFDLKEISGKSGPARMICEYV